jgi:hypothetical protein
VDWREQATGLTPLAAAGPEPGKVAGGFQPGLSIQMLDVSAILAHPLALIAAAQAIEWCLLRPFERHVTRWR